MNKLGQTWAYGFMLGVLLFVLALGLAPAGQRFVNDAMNSSTSDFIGLDCNNESISNFQKGTCVITDFSSAYFFGGLILLSLGIIGAKIVSD